MRTIELSNHPDAMRRAAHEGREAQAAEAQERYEQALAEHGRKVEELREQRDRARAARRWGSWMRGSFAIRGARKREPGQPAPPPVDVHRESILASGIQGEERVAREFAAALGDEWTLLRGYRNRSGEIDQILLGPRGIVAIEVKNRNATVHVDGDEWYYEKFDRYGNRVQTGYITDRGGRSPSQQLNEPTDALVEFLASRGCHVSIARAVLLTHERSRVGRFKDATVAIVCNSTDYLLKWLAKHEVTVTPELHAEVERLIQRDHRHHEQQRRTRR